MKRTLFAALFVLSCLAPPAEATKPKCRLERLDPSLLPDGKLRLYAAPVELEGNVIDDLRTQQFSLLVNGKKAGKAEKMQPFSAAREPVYVMLVVEIAAQFRQAFEQVKEALKDFLENQPSSMKVALVTYGADVEKRTPFIPAPSMSVEVDDLSADDDSADVRMVDALRLALTELRKLEPGAAELNKVAPRRLIVLVSDGLNFKMDRKTFKEMGEASARAGVPIHTIAFSPIDARGPLLNLGDLSKRSNGTFRWAQKTADLRAQLDTLADEVRKQYVLTFPTKLSSTEKHTFGLYCRDLKSNVLGGKGQFGYVPAGSSGGLAWWVWALIVLGAIVGLLAVLWIIGSLLSVRAGAARARPAAAPSVGRAVAAAGGSPQRYAAAPTATPATPRTVRSAVLIGVTGDVAGQRIPLGSRITIGKAENHHVVVQSPTVSRNHCELRLEGTAYVVVDLGSTNGTFVNGRPVGAPERLGDGDILRIGKDTQFKLRIDYG